MRIATILCLLAAAFLSNARAQDAKPAQAKAKDPAKAPPVIDTHQIDRHQAIQDLQKDLEKDPKNKADWIILAELAQEVALDSPADQAASYYRMAREAYEKALALSPDEPGLKAAVQFARDQEANAEKFSASRRKTTQSYLAARRRELGRANALPAIRVYPPRPVRIVAVAEQPPSNATAATTGPAVAPAVPGVPYETNTPYYRTYLGPGGVPLTYDQYSNTYFPMMIIGSDSQGLYPITPRGFYPHLP
jgi:tetratricopeptide (TPR) repeat protein